jgi:hypothetical protein
VNISELTWKAMVAYVEEMTLITSEEGKDRENAVQSGKHGVVQLLSSWRKLIVCFCLNMLC